MISLAPAIEVNRQTGVSYLLQLTGSECALLGLYSVTGPFFIHTTIFTALALRSNRLFCSMSE